MKKVAFVLASTILCIAVGNFVVSLLTMIQDD